MVRGFRELARQALKFGLVGILNSAITYASFLLLYRFFGLGEYASNAASYLLGLLNSFLWNKLWTFKSKGFKPIEAVWFALVFLVSYALQLCAYRALRLAGLPGELAQLIAMAAYTAANFAGNRTLTFGKEKEMPSAKKTTMLITGASSGIGKCLAELAASRGYDLALVARGTAKLEALAAELRGTHGVSCSVLTSDLSLPGAAERLHQECVKRGLQVDILVNNAGVGLFGPVLGQAPEEYAKMIQLNVVALTELCSYFGRDMAARGDGRILNVASMVALMPVPYFSTYAASKAYVRSYTAALRAELAPKGVTAGCVLPGYVKTNFDAASHVTDDNYKKMSERMGMDPRRVARIALRTAERGRAHVVAGLSNRVGACFIALIPKNFLASVMNFFLGRMIGK
jgi:short-subunit dehydrogenase/putative flippase GtrA